MKMEMPSSTVDFAQDMTPQDNHNHRFVAVGVVEQMQEQELVPDTVAAAVDTAGKLEELELRLVHHTQNDLQFAPERCEPGAASAVEPLDRRRVAQRYRQGPVVPRDRSGWDSQQEPTLRRQYLPTNLPWANFHRFPVARISSH